MTQNLFEIILNNISNPHPICVFHENYQLKKSLTCKDIIELTEIYAHNLNIKTSNVKNENIIISLDNQWEFLISFFACVQTGNYPVPVCSKSLMATNDFHELIINIGSASDAKFIITNEPTKKYLPNIYKTQFVSIDHLIKPCEKTFKFHSDFKSDDRLFIQFSSGSTNIPKGVIITHENLISNLLQIKEGLGLDPKIDSSLSWLPLHHDMGLIGMVFSAIYNLGTTHIISPVDFIKSPYAWLKLASDLKVSIINSPNSGYHTCNNKISDDELLTLDLKKIRVALCGAEPVNPIVLRRFEEKFSKCHLKPNSFLPVYGLAEATLAVTFPKVNEKVKTCKLNFNELIKNKITPIDDNSIEHIEIVSCGKPLKNTQIKITDELGNDLFEEKIGQIMIKGPSISKGYYQSNHQIKEIQKDGWCDTGDMGFIKDGELYITGRKKDLVIINGKNISPHDLEIKISHLKSLRMGRIVVFSTILPYEEKEKVFIIAESNILSRKKRAQIKKQICEILSPYIPITLEQVYLIPPFHMKKTTSGKVRRFLMKELFLSGDIKNYEQHFFNNYLKSKLFVFKFILKNIKF